MRAGAPQRAHLRALKRSLLALLYPQGTLCHACGQPLGLPQERLLCVRCGQGLEESALPPESQPSQVGPWLPQVYGAFAHQGPARYLVHSLKYAGNLTAALPLSLGMAGLFVHHPTLRQVDRLVPVPLHPKRRRWRGYNQAEVLAAQLAWHTGRPHCPQALKRVRHTRQQVGAARQDRQANMAGAFVVENPALVQGKRILLVDDVCTTGATAAACAQALFAAEAAEVALLVACQA